MVEISKYGSGEGRPRVIGGAYSTGKDEWNGRISFFNTLFRGDDEIRDRT